MVSFQFLFLFIYIFFFLNWELNTPVPFRCQRELRSSCPSSLRFLFGLPWHTHNNNSNKCRSRRTNGRSRATSAAVAASARYVCVCVRVFPCTYSFLPFMTVCELGVCVCECFHFFLSACVFFSLHGNWQSLNPISSTLALVGNGPRAPASAPVPVPALAESLNSRNIEKKN